MKLLFFLLFIFLSSCGDQSGEFVKVKLNIPSNRQVNLADQFSPSFGKEALSNCNLPSFKIKVNGPGINPPIISAHINASLDNYTSFTLGQSISINIPKGVGRFIDAKALAYDSTCDVVTASYQTIIAYGRVGPLNIDSAVSISMPLVISTALTQITTAVGSPLNFTNFSTLFHPANVPYCAGAYSIRLQDLDLEDPIVYTASNISTLFYIGPVFPFSHYDMTYTCTGGTPGPTYGSADTLGPGTTATIN